MKHFGHTLYTASDFTNEDLDSNQLAKLVVEGGLGICKNCAAGEVHLDDFKTCAEYIAHRALENHLNKIVRVVEPGTQVFNPETGEEDLTITGGVMLITASVAYCTRPEYELMIRNLQSDRPDDDGS